MIGSIDLLRWVSRSLRRAIYRLACAGYFICRPFVGHTTSGWILPLRDGQELGDFFTTGRRGSEGSVYIHNGPDTAGVLQHTGF